MADFSDKRRAHSQHIRSQWVASIAAVVCTLYAGYLLGKAAAAGGSPAHLDARSHAAAGTTAPGTASDAAAADSRRLQLSHETGLKQIGIAVAVSAKPEHVLQLLSMLLPSWQMLRSRPEARRVVLDLLVFCDGASCQELPPECRPMRGPGEGGQLFPHDEVSNCWFTAQDAAANARWQGYPYMNSIQFLLQREMVAIAPRYDSILRTDEDVFLTPQLLTWRPPHDAMFGEAGYWDPFNQQRLPQVAAKYGLKHRGVTNICSTWLAPPRLALDFARLSLEVGRKMWDNEWNMTLPGLAEHAGTEGWSADGKWPEWWKHVISMYAAELAINHLLPDIQQSHVSPGIDTWSFLDTPISELVHIHCGQSPELFSKWQFRDTLLAMPGRVPTAERRAQYEKQPLAPISDDMSARQYANSVAQQTARAAAAVAMFTTL